MEVKRAEELTENYEIKRKLATTLISYVNKIIRTDTNYNCGPPCNETINAVSRLSDSIRYLLED